MRDGAPLEAGLSSAALLPRRGLMAKRMRRLWKRRRRDSLTNLRATRRRHLVPVDQPLVLISQVSRSGGTLLSQLFAGHPECHVRPGELLIGRPKDCWPDAWSRISATVPRPPVISIASANLPTISMGEADTM